MNNNNRDDELRFNKLYELLGDDVNQIYETKNADEIFDDYNNINNIYNNQEDNITREIFIEPTKIKIENEIKSNNVRGNVTNEKNANKKTIVFDSKLDVIGDKDSKLINIIGNHVFLGIMSVLLLIFVSVLSIKAINYGKIVKNYNNYVSDEDNNSKVYEDKSNTQIYKGSKAGKLVNCISESIDMNALPESVTDIIDKINDYYRSNDSYFAFAYKDIFTGFTVTYNENGNIFAASTIKAPVNIYIYEMAANGQINLDDVLTYTKYYYNNGTGVLKNQPFDGVYSIRKLSEYAIRNSDNAAHNMLMDKYGKNNILDFWRNKGTNIIFTGNDNWGMINAHDALIYMEELYKFYLDNDEYGGELMNNFLNTKTKFITGHDNYKVANKTGWSGYSQHDASIVFDDNPYIVIALSNMGMDDSYMSHFNKVNDLTYALHNAYWKYKIDQCGNMKFYQE